LASLLLCETVGRVENARTSSDQVIIEFSTMNRAFFTVFRCIVGGDCADINGRPLWLQLTQRLGWGYGVMYVAMTMFVCFGLFNVIVALFVENVVNASKTDERMKRRSRLRDQTFFAQKMTELIGVLVRLQEEALESVHQRSERCASNRDSSRASTRRNSRQDNSASYEAILQASKSEITPQVFERLRLDPAAIDIFEDLDIADEDRFSLFETLDADHSGAIDLAELIDGVWKLRGEARRSDIIALDFIMQRLSSQIEESFSEMLARCSSLEASISRVSSSAAPPREPRSGVCLNQVASTT